MNLYKSLLLSAVIVTSFGAAFAGGDNEAPTQGRAAAVASFLKTNKDTVVAFCANQSAAAKTECQALVASVKERNIRQVVTNKAFISAAVTTVVAAGAGIYAWIVNRNAKAQAAHVVDPNVAPAPEAQAAE